MDTKVRFFPFLVLQIHLRKIKNKTNRIKKNTRKLFTVIIMLLNNHAQATTLIILPRFGADVTSETKKSPI